jgi:hypothetical protein
MWHLYPQKLAIASPTSGGRSVGIVCSRTQTMEFSLVVIKFLLFFRSELPCDTFSWQNYELAVTRLERWNYYCRYECCHADILLGLFGPEESRWISKRTTWPHVPDDRECSTGLFIIWTIFAWETYCTNTRGHSIGVDNGKLNLTQQILTQKLHKEWSFGLKQTNFIWVFNHEKRGIIAVRQYGDILVNEKKYSRPMCDACWLTETKQTNQFTPLKVVL